MSVYNFSAGPAVMPKPVIEQIQRELPSLNNSGMSILEISHRSQQFEQIMADAVANIKDLMAIPDDYHVLFLQGGGTGQFAAAPLNLATKHRSIALLDSGHWAAKAGAEAKKLGFNVTTLATTESGKYRELPRLNQTIPANSFDYLHVTINNTIEGTAYHEVPESNIPIIGDMSSNFLGERYNVKDFGMIFAGAQKNLGPAGVTIVIIKDELMHHVDGIPSIFDYQLNSDKNSMLNTPPVFAIYASGLVLKWLKEQGGVDEMEKRNRAKSSKFYDYLDQSHLFNCPAFKADRSLTNIVFSTTHDKLDQAFVEEATNAGLLNLKGHRSVGGLRASLYNAMPMAGVDALIDFLYQFEKDHKEVTTHVSN